MKNCSNMEFNDFFIEIQKLDINLLYLIINSIFIGYVNYNITNKLMQNYSLRKDFNIKKNQKIILPPEITKKVEDIDKEYLNKQALKDEVINFIETIKRNDSNIDLTLLYNNLSTIKISLSDLKFRNMLSNSKAAGYYDYLFNSIKIDKNYLSSINHELFHVASTIKKDKIYFSGFSLIYPNSKFGFGINEGYTQLLTNRYFQKTLSYQYETMIAEAVEILIEENKMKSLYFSANLKGLIDELSKYAPYDEILNFINKIDFISKHINEKKFLTNKNKLILDCLKYNTKFLLKCITNKLCNSNYNNKELYYKIYKFLEIVSWYEIATKNDNYMFFTEEELSSLIDDSLNIIVKKLDLHKEIVN